MRVYLDDERVTPEGFDVRVYTAQQAIDWLKTNKVTLISLDHDLGDDANGTGYTVACFIEKGAMEDTLDPLRVLIHSANPVGRQRMAVCINRAEAHWYRT